MNIRAAVFDIDGTLVPHGAKGPGKKTADAVRALKEAGIPVIIATGRARFAAKAILGPIRPDYYVSINGADVTDSAGRAVWQNRMTQAEMNVLVDFCDDYELPLEFIFSDGYYTYVEHEAMQRHFEEHPEMLPFLIDGGDRIRHLKGMPFGACASMTEEHAAEFREQYGCLGLRLLRFLPDYYDVIRPGSSKKAGVSRILDRLGIGWAETAAFGDAENDEELLKAAGFAVAMENGSDVLKAGADCIAPPVEQDGAAAVITEKLLH